MKKGYPIPLPVDALMAKAREIADVDIVDHAVVEPLAIMHRSLCEEADLHEAGALGMQNKLISLLANRLRMQRDFARHSKIARQEIKGPLVIMGLPRSGTTKTHKVLAASGDFNWMSFWQVYNWASFSGRPNETTAARTKEADDYCRWYHAGSPEFKYGHPFETFEPEEESFLEGSFVAPAMIGYAGMISYLQWLMTQPPAVTIGFLSDTLKYLQWQGLADPAKPWLLKSPLYQGLELEILKVFPNARFVMLHRSVTKTVASACKLNTCYRKPFTDAIPDFGMLIEGLSMGMDGHLANRAAPAGLPLLDLSFDEITTSLPVAVEKIYRHAGMPLQDAARERMARWDTENPMHKQGEFRYTLEEFGLTEDAVQTRLAAYIDLQRQLFGRAL